MGSKKGSKQPWYKYRVGMHLAICRGPVDAVLGLTFGDRVGWTGSQTANGTFTVSKPDLFGGKKKEGGVEGRVDVLMGDSTQTANPYLQAVIRPNLPGFRGILTLVFRGLNGGGFYWAANNPYIKPVAVTVRRILSGWDGGEPWYPAKAAIGPDMNPAHIIYECLTNRDWGMGYPAAAMDGAAFTAAADQLYTESFGVSLMWARQAPIEEFIKEIQTHITGSVYLDRTTGKYTLKLLREDYDVGTLLEFDPSNILEFQEFQRATWGETVNEVTVTYTDPATEDAASVTVHDLANIRIQGGAVSQTRSYSGIRNQALAGRIAERDLRSASTPLSGVRFIANRAAWNVNHGDAIKVTWPDYGLQQAVYRVVKADYGTLTDGRISIEAVEDVFALPGETYSAGQESGWINPASAPADITDYIFLEATHYDLANRVSAADLSALTGTEAFPLVCAARPAAQNQSVIVYTTPNPGTTSYEPQIEGLYTPSVYANGAVTQLVTVIPYDGAHDLTVAGAVDLYAQWDDEVIHITNIDTGAGELTVERGVLDTVPQLHADNSRIWIHNGKDCAYEGTYDFDRGELVYIKPVGRSTAETGTVGGAVQSTRTMTARWSKPWPPANVQVNGALFPPTVARYPTITWVGRNRLTQDTGFTPWTASNIAPEGGTTYTLQIYNHDTSALIVSATGLTVSGSVGTYNMLTANSAAKYRIELWAVVGGVASEYKFSHVCDVPLISFDAALLHFDGTDGAVTFTDESGKLWTTNGGEHIRTAQYAALTGNTASGYFDGTGDYIVSPVSNDFDFTGDFTVECWARFDNLSSIRGVWYLGNNLSNNHRIQCEVRTNGSIEFYGATTGTVWWPTSAAGTIVANTWYHIACVRQGLTARLFVNGTQVATDTITGTPVTNKTLRIGNARVSDNQTYMAGYIDEFRAKKDEAVYTANFTPPAAPFAYDPP